ncbi:MAG: hypothetical protein AAF065_06420 [Verrucomicrobiota bacterium]
MKSTKLFAIISIYSALNLSFNLSTYASSIMFSGVIDFVKDDSNIWNSGIFVGAPISGTITYNSLASPRTFLNTSRLYRDDVNISATFIVGSSTWRLSNPNLFEVIEVKNTIPEDSFQLDSVGTNPDLFPSFLGQYNFQFGFGETDRFKDIWSNPELPREDGDVDFLNTEFISGNLQNEGGLQFAAFTFQIPSNSILLSSVPETKSIALVLGNIALVFTLFSRKRRHRPTTSERSDRILFVHAMSLTSFAILNK